MGITKEKLLLTISALLARKVVRRGKGISWGILVNLPTILSEKLVRSIQWEVRRQNTEILGV